MDSLGFGIVDLGLLLRAQQDLAVGKFLSQAGYVAYRTKDGSQVREIEQGWPNPDGLSGQVIAFPLERDAHNLA